MKIEPHNAMEVKRLIDMARLHLNDARQEASVSLEGRFLAAYSAAHAVALAALRRHGFRSTNRYLVFQSLAHTLDWPAERWRLLDHAHNQRNLAEYEGFLEVEVSQVASLVAISTQLLADFEAKSSG